VISGPLALAALVLLGGAAIAALLVFWAGARRGRFAPVPLAVLAVCLGALALGAGMRGRSAGVESCAAELRRLGAAVELYAQGAAAGEAPATLDALVPYYFSALPSCPLAGGAGNPYVEGYERRGAVFTILCSGAHHAGLGGAPQDFPRFTSSEGLQAAP